MGLVTGIVMLMCVLAGCSPSPASDANRAVREHSVIVQNDVAARMTAGQDLTVAVDSLVSARDLNSSFSYLRVTANGSTDPLILFMVRSGGGSGFNTEPNVSVCLGLSIEDEDDAAKRSLRMSQVDCPDLDQNGDGVPGGVYDDPGVRTRTVRLSEVTPTTAVSRTE